MLVTLIASLFFLVSAQAGYFQKPIHIATFAAAPSKYPVKIIRITKTVAVPIPYPVPVAKEVHVPVSVPQPVPYAVPQPIPVEITKPVVIPHAVPVEVPKPYAVPHPVPFKQPQLVIASPAEHLIPPQYNDNQQSDYQGYVAYGTGASYDTPVSGYGTESGGYGNQPVYQVYQSPGYGNDQGQYVEQSNYDNNYGTSGAGYTSGTPDKETHDAVQEGSNSIESNSGSKVDRSY